MSSSAFSQEPDTSHKTNEPTTPGAGDCITEQQTTTDNRVYMDYNATTPLHPEVREAMIDAMERLWRNPSSSYSGAVREAITTARKQVAALLNSMEEEIIFTSSGTEADNWILESVVMNASLQQKADGEKIKPHVIITDIEHDAITKKLDDLQRRGFCEVEKISASDQGRIRVASDVIARCRPTTCLISIMIANNETGVIQPVAQIGSALSEFNHARAQRGEQRILFHSDAAQGFGKIEVNVKELGVDFLTIVGHKFYGPRMGALYCRKECVDLMKPIFFGGGQERNFRPGTENTVDIVGLGKAAELARLHREEWCRNFIELGEYFAAAMKNTFGDEFGLNFPVNSRSILPNTFSLHFVDPRCKGYLVLQRVKLIEASTGAACHSGKNFASAVLLNSGVPLEAAQNTLRLSFGKDTTRKQIDLAVADLAQAINILTVECETAN